MSAPAVPTASNAVAPTTKIESTAQAPAGESVSSIGTGGPQSSEAVYHSGALNTIDVYLRMQFIALASFVWNTQQQPGTLLWTTKISPAYSHQFIKYLSKMYNVWVGGFLYNIKMCGTGFHSGALAVVRVPPNIDPKSISSPADFTAFEYVILDPKTLEVVTEHLIDQRQTMYHYVEDTNDKNAIGGHIAVYVLVPLNTSSTGAQSISVQVLTKPSPDFNFLQPRPVVRDNIDPVTELPDADRIAQSLTIPVNGENGTSIFKDKVSKIAVVPKTIVDPLSSTVGMYNFSGERVGPEGDDHFPIPSNGFSKSKIRVIKKPERVNPDLAAAGEYAVSVDKIGSLPEPSGTFSIRYVDNGTMRSNAVCAPSSESKTWLNNTEFKIANNKEISLTTDKDSNGFFRFDTYLEKDRKKFNKNTQESFILFQNPQEIGDAQRQAYQPENLAAMLKTGKYVNVMTPQDAMIIDMYETESQVPIRRCKLYYGGFLTTSGTDDEVQLPASNYYFKFVQFARALEPIPAAPKEMRFHWRLLAPKPTPVVSALASTSTEETS